MRMELKSVRVQNYRCIEDSNEFSVGEVVCLVGKNEAGKSSILQALYKLNPVVEEAGRFDDVEDYPRRRYSEYKKRRDENPDNVLTTVWALGEDDVSALEEVVGPGVVPRREVVITKGYDNRLLFNLELDEKKAVGQIASAVGLSLKKIQGLEKVESVDQLRESLKAISPPPDDHAKLQTELQKRYGNDSLTTRASTLLTARLPKFLYFPDYEKMKGKISIGDLVARR